MEPKPNLNTFRTINDFINELNDFFGKKQNSLQLYHRLIKRTEIADTKMIIKHIEVFTKFCVGNRKGIQDKDINKFSSHKISFSDRIYINLLPIMNHKDKDVVKTVWKYLLTISALVDKESRAKSILYNDGSSGMGGGLMGDMMGTIQQEIDAANIQDTGNPLEMMGSLMASGALSNIMTSFTDKMNNGEFDIMSLMGEAQNMMQGLQSSEGGENPMMNPLIQNMMQTMMPPIPVQPVSQQPPVIEDLLNLDDVVVDEVVAPLETVGEEVVGEEVVVDDMSIE